MESAVYAYPAAGDWKRVFYRQIEAYVSGRPSLPLFLALRLSE